MTIERGQMTSCKSMLEIKRECRISEVRLNGNRCVRFKTKAHLLWEDILPTLCYIDCLNARARNKQQKGRSMCDHTHTHNSSRRRGVCYIEEIATALLAESHQVPDSALGSMVVRTILPSRPSWPSRKMSSGQNLLNASESRILCVRCGVVWCGGASSTARRAECYKRYALFGTQLLF